MKLGALLMPSHPPERSIRDGQRWDLNDLERLDALGFEEAWIGEHFTAAWEPCPAPDLLIAQALLRTKRIRLGPLSHLLPFHHPVELAHRVAYLDHMAEGRYQVGVGIGVLPTDHSLFALDVSHGRNRRMTFEAVDMMTRLWTEGASEFRGRVLVDGCCTRSDLPGDWATTLFLIRSRTPGCHRRADGRIGEPQACRREGLYPGQPGHRSRRIDHREALGCGRRGRGPNRSHTRPQRVAHHSGRLRRADGRRGARTCHRRHHGPLLA